MANNMFCDKEPCDWLKKFVEKFAIRDREYAEFKGETFGTVQVSALRRLKKHPKELEPPGRITLWYCPFCGTRLKGNRDTLKWIDAKLRGQ